MTTLSYEKGDYDVAIKQLKVVKNLSNSNLCIRVATFEVKAGVHQRTHSILKGLAGHPYYIQYTVFGGDESNLNVSVATQYTLSFTCITIKLLKFQVQKTLRNNKLYNKSWNPMI